MSRNPVMNAFALALAMVIGLVGTGAAAPSGSPQRPVQGDAQQGWSPPRTVYIPQTGHSIDGVFLDVWRAWSGAASWGYPITEELEEDGRTVQYFEFGRFEYWPEDPNGNVVHFGDIGAELLDVHVKNVQETASDSDETPPVVRANEPVERDDVDLTIPERRYIEETGHTVSWGFKDFWEATGEADYLGLPLTQEYTVDDYTYQFFERGQLRWQPQGKVRMVPVGRELAEARGLDMSPAPQGNLPAYSEDLFVPPAPTATSAPQPDPTAEKWIEVNLSTQYMIAWQGDVRVNESYVSTGKAGFETPPGTYQILVKKPVEDMEGVIGGEYYNVPDVPDVLYFTNVGHAFHGTYWHSNFGVPMSHGCVNLPLGVAEWLYAWAPIGTRVEIHY